MSVYIKGMKMPAQCDDCPVFDDNGDYPTCILTGHSRGYNWSPFGQRMPDCPLIHILPHGRLIDADALRQTMYHEAFETDSPMQKWDSGCWIRYKMFERMEETAPTIIEAEEAE